MPILDLPANFPLKNFVTEVSPDDDMFASSELYIAAGLSALKLMDYAIDRNLLQLNGPLKILDLPCGYGRVARVLRSRFADADLTVCDLNHEAVDFCSSQFHATGVYSTVNFDTMDLRRQFDLIWVGSLITHLEKSNTVKFIRCMQRHLCDNGLLILTSSGRHIAEVASSGNTLYLDAARVPNLLSAYNAVGYGYEDYPNNVGYGVSIISRHWLEGFFASEPCGIVDYLEQGWDDWLDVSFVRKNN